MEVVFAGFAILAVVAEPPRHLRHRRVVGRERTAVAERAERLERVEAEASDFTEGTGHLRPQRSPPLHMHRITMK